MARHSGLTPTTIGRIWRAFGLAPHRVETFKFSTDPNFETKMADIVGLYLDPPERALVLCVDEIEVLEINGWGQRVRLDEAEGVAGLGPVVEVSADLSERTDGGRAVMALRFRSGLRLIYKPRTLVAEARFGALVDWMNAAGARDSSSIRVLSPRIDPRLRREVGSTASTATRWPCPIR